MTKEADFIPGSFEAATAERKRGLVFRSEFNAFLFVYFGLFKVPQSIRRFALKDVVGSAVVGERRIMGSDAEVFLGPFDLNISGLGNIPRTGPVLLTANHWGYGPYNGNWTHYALSQVVLQGREERENLRIIMQDGMLFPYTSYRIPHTQKYAKMISKMYGHILVPPVKRIDAGKEVSSLSELKTLRGAFEQNQVIGLYPEAKESRQFRLGHPSAGAVAWSLAQIRDDALVLPVGLHSNKRDILSIKVGEPYPLVEIDWPLRRADIDLKRRAYGKISQYMMNKIKPLVPSWAFA